MASAVLQNGVIMLPSHLNEALECQEMNKQLLRKLFKVKIFNDQRSAFLIESAKTELCEEKLKKKLQKQSEKEQQIGKNNLTIQNSYNDFLFTFSTNSNNFSRCYATHQLHADANGIRHNCTFLAA